MKCKNCKHAIVLDEVTKKYKHSEKTHDNYCQCKKAEPVEVKEVAK